MMQSKYDHEVCPRIHADFQHVSRSEAYVATTGACMFGRSSF